MSRKLIFASGLLACFACNLDEDLQKKISTENRDINLKHLANHIWEYLNSTPLDILAFSCEKYGIAAEASIKIFSAYDDFLGLVSNPQSRAELKDISARNSRDSQLFGRVREISRSFEEGLNAIFFQNNRLRPLTEKYGVF